LDGLHFRTKVLQMPPSVKRILLFSIMAFWIASFPYRDSSIIWIESNSYAIHITQENRL
jgi:hypothetical protein